MGSSSKKPRAFYHPENKRKKKTGKTADMVRQSLTLKKRIEKEGETKWLKNASAVLEKRLKKAGLKTA